MSASSIVLGSSSTFERLRRGGLLGLLLRPAVAGATELVVDVHLGAELLRVVGSRSAHAVARQDPVRARDDLLQSRLRVLRDLLADGRFDPRAEQPLHELA